MRVPLNRRKRDERGAMAIVVALLFFFVVFGFASIVVDAGQAVANKRQLQGATDAGALAGALVYTDEVGTCQQLAANGALRLEAEDAANDVAEDNRGGQQQLEFNVRCITDPADRYVGGIEVTYGADRDTPSYFGPGGPITADADARAVTFVPGAAERFRPYGICSADVPPVGAMPGAVVEIAQPGQAAGRSGCPSADNGGNWWFMNCPGSPNGGMNPDAVAQVLREGCVNPAEVVTPQNPASASTLSASLTVNCNDHGDKSISCLDAETGISDLKNKTPVAEWTGLLGQTIIVPVFCARNTCDPTTVDGSGTGNVYPVYKFTAITICGYHIYAKTFGVSSTGDCAGNTFSSTYVDKLGCANDNDPCLMTYDDNGVATGLKERPKDSVRLFVRFQRNVAGLARPTGCVIGSACDGGLRISALTE
ncbi:pilus assembly protein TadG-related protein [Nocardioides allogilvus]|uniref:pilus assembly protein TadG-related protein n=1 Tax=Nocardioides allogilvus TaxID=2072017 RepID=UPI000D3109D5|nr:Tad domain-containing protein [Nocardioides allogilvus]